MKLIAKLSQLNGTPDNFLRTLGYGFIVDRRNNKESYVRRLGSYHYPRLHLYYDMLPDNKVLFSVHLDQKQASYEGTHMHNAEYDSPVVAEELDRIRSYLSERPTSVPVNAKEMQKDPLERIGHRDYRQAMPQAPAKKSWLAKIFGL